MYITNNPAVAQIAEQAGVDWIFVDMEFIGKDARQHGLDTVQNHHTIQDIRNIRAAVKQSKVLVRVNSIHPECDGYFDSEHEIDAAVEAGADILMLPYFHTVSEVARFVNYVQESAKKYGRNVKTCLLLETPDAVIMLDEILNVKGIDMVHVGLNDLHLGLGMKFLFELLANGMVDEIARKLRARGIPFGFGGIAGLHTGALPGEMVLKEHYRLGSSMVILGRSFCNTQKITNLDEIRHIFTTGVAEIRRLENEARQALNYFEDNHRQVTEIVDKIVANINNK